VLYNDFTVLFEDPPITGLVVGSVGLFVVVARYRILQRARKLVQADKKRYEAVWERVQRDAASGAVFCDLQRAVDAFPIREMSHQHMNRGGDESLQPYEFGSGLVPSFMKGRRVADQEMMMRASRSPSRSPSFGGRSPSGDTLLKIRQPVSSLDQLYAQSLCLAPIFKDKVKGWAMESQGMFPMKDRHIGKATGQVFVRWDRIAGRADKEAQIKWPGVKKIDRCIEKLTRSYGEDVSLVVDVTRESIIFEEISHITSCLKTIASDQEVEVVRCKNRMSPHYSGSETAGFRNLMLNVRIRNADTLRLGVELHVSELQLILKDFAEIKSDDGHRRYREFRNARAE